MSRRDLSNPATSEYAGNSERASAKSGIAWQAPLRGTHLNDGPLSSEWWVVAGEA